MTEIAYPPRDLARTPVGFVSDLKNELLEFRFGLEGRGQRLARQIPQTIIAAFLESP
jgi:hypothetical protein